MSCEPYSEKTKNLSIQETIEYYLKLIPKPKLPKGRLIELDSQKNAIFTHTPRVSNCGQSMSKKIEKIIKSSSQNSLKNKEFLKKMNNPMTSRASQLLKKMPKEIMNKNKTITKISYKNRVKKVDCATYTRSTCLKKGEDSKILKHLRNSSSADLSKITITGWETTLAD